MRMLATSLMPEILCGFRSLLVEEDGTLLAKLKVIIGLKVAGFISGRFAGTLTRRSSLDHWLGTTMVLMMVIHYGGVSGARRN